MATSWSMPAGSSDRWAEDYQRGRPGWPPEVLDAPGLAPTTAVLELAAGTGKLTHLLAAAFDRVVAVEPAEPMSRLLLQSCPEANLLAGSAEEIPVADRSVDAVFAAESFHLFDGDRALAEIARVLRPRGTLVLLWNLPAGSTEPSIAAVEQLLSERARAEEGRGRLRPAGPQLDSLRIPRVVPGLPTDAVRGAPGEAAREHPDGRPGRDRGVLRLDGLD